MGPRWIGRRSRGPSLPLGNRRPRAAFGRAAPGRARTRLGAWAQRVKGKPAETAGRWRKSGSYFSCFVAGGWGGQNGDRPMRVAAPIFGRRGSGKRSDRQFHCRTFSGGTHRPHPLPFLPKPEGARPPPLRLPGGQSARCSMDWLFWALRPGARGAGSGPLVAAGWRCLVVYVCTSAGIRPWEAGGASFRPSSWKS